MNKPLLHCIKWILDFVDNLTQQPDEFDLRHRVETRGILRVFSTISTASMLNGNRYEGCDHQSLQNTLQLLAHHVALMHFSFVDIGCGKGRALIVASEFPFQRIVGVDHSPELVTFARRNAPSATLVVGDATTYCFEQHPTVVFFYNPFRERETLSRVLQNLKKNLIDNRLPLAIVYQGSGVEPIATCPWLMKVNEASSTKLFISEAFESLR
jgi:SAM-dependent methyltransferase